MPCMSFTNPFHAMIREHIPKHYSSYNKSRRLLLLSAYEIPQRIQSLAELFIRLCRTGGDPDRIGPHLISHRESLGSKDAAPPLTGECDANDESHQFLQKKKAERS